LGKDRNPSIYGITVGELAERTSPANLFGVGRDDASLAQVAAATGQFHRVVL
jgi:hypothetical protein